MVPAFATIEPPDIAPVRVVVPPPICCTTPPPVIAPATVSASDRFRARTPLFVIAPGNVPAVPPAPICKVPPAVMVVLPRKPSLLPLRSSVPPLTEIVDALDPRPLRLPEMVQVLVPSLMILLKLKRLPGMIEDGPGSLALPSRRSSFVPPPPLMVPVKVAPL